MLDLGTVVGQEHDSRDLFEKVFQRLDADASLDVTRVEFKRYFCPLDDLRSTTTKTTNDEASGTRASEAHERARARAIGRRRGDCAAVAISRDSEGGGRTWFSSFAYARGWG